MTRFQSAEAIRQAGRARLEQWLTTHGTYKPAQLAERAIKAAQLQHIVVSGHAAAEAVVRRLAHQILTLDRERDEIEAEIEVRFVQHRDAPVIESMPGIGPVLGAEILAATGGNITAMGSSNRLAAAAGLAPVRRDSGRIDGNYRRPRSYDRRLLHAFYFSAQQSVRYDPQSQAYYARKRLEGKRHTQAVIALARRRINVLWAMVRDGTAYEAVRAQPAT